MFFFLFAQFDLYFILSHFAFFFLSFSFHTVIRRRRTGCERRQCPSSGRSDPSQQRRRAGGERRWDQRTCRRQEREIGAPGQTDEAGHSDRLRWLNDRRANRAHSGHPVLREDLRHRGQAVEEHVRQSAGQAFDYRCDGARRCRSRRSTAGRHSVARLLGQGESFHDININYQHIKVTFK